MTNFIEAQDEAKQLTKNLRRQVEVKPFDCDCDYSKDCGRCAGQGIYYSLVFASCEHSVEDADTCYEEFCGEREQVEGETFPVEHEPLRSLTEAA